MEKVRQCGWIEADGGPKRAVWVRKGVATDSCPVSYVSAESLALVQEFQAWKLIGGCSVYELPSKTAEALCVLENELRAEMKSEY